MTNNSHPIFYYDASCKFCSKTKDFFFRIDNKNTSFYPLSPKNIIYFQKKLALSRELSKNVMYYKNRRGIVSYGSYAFFEYLKDKKGLFHYLGLLGEISPIKWFSKQFYYCIALNRYLISKFFL